MDISYNIMNHRGFKMKILYSTTTLYGIEVINEIALASSHSSSHDVHRIQRARIPHCIIIIVVNGKTNTYYYTALV